MNKEYKYTFKQIIENLNFFKLGTIIESDYGIKYKMTKTDNNRRKFSRVNKGLRFMTYENMDRLFRIVEESEQDIDIQAINELIIHKNVDNYNKTSIDSNRETINKLIKAVKQLDVKLQSIKQIQ